MNPFQERKNNLLLLKSIKGQKDAVIYDIMSKQREVTCEHCSKVFSKEVMDEGLKVCPHCGYHDKLGAWDRIHALADPDTFQEMDSTLKGVNPLNFPGYSQKIKAVKKATGLGEAVVWGTCRIKNTPAVVAVMDSGFIMGSMGTAVGEKITRAVEYATDHGLGVVIFSASGGARMQEGMLSLMQMAKTAAALERHSSQGLFYLSVLTNPTTGGVTASFAFLGDIILAEPGALIGFAGPRVIKETIKQDLPQGFQRSEYLLEHGFLDGITQRKDMREEIGRLLAFHRR